MSKADTDGPSEVASHKSTLIIATSSSLSQHEVSPASL